MNIKPNPMTKETKERLERELAEAKKEVVAAGRRAGEAAKQGDLRENSGYELARDEQAAAQAQVLMLKQSLLKPQIIEPRQETATIGLGNKVTVQFEDGSQMSLTLLGSEDGATRDEWLSCDTPIGKEILGRSAGDEVTLESGRIKILKVEPGDF